MFWEFYPPDSKGVALWIRGVAFSKYLKRLGCEVVVFAPDFDGKSSEYVHEGVPVKRVETYDSARQKGGAVPAMTKLTKIQLDLVSFARQVSPDLVVVSQPSYSLPAQALAVARMLSVPCVIDMQDIFAQDVEFSPNRLRNAMKKRLEAFVLRNSDHVVTVLPTMRDMAIERYGLDRTKFHILYNGFDSEMLPEGSPSSDQKDIDLLNLGAPRLYNDSLTLIDALAIVAESKPDIKLVFTGCIRDWFEKEVRERVKTLGLDSNVDFLGHIPSRVGVFELMNRARMGVFSLYPRKSSKVMVGTKFFEYMAFGLPVAHLGIESGTSDVLVRKHKMGISASDAASFAKEVLTALGDDAMLDEYAKNAREASANYDWKRAVPIMYEDVLLKLSK